MSGSIEIGRGVRIPLAEIELRASRSGGPGGQHANVTASRVEAAFDISASGSLTPAQKRILIERLGSTARAVSKESRSQTRNREIAIERLRERLAAGMRRPKQRRPTRPSRAARRRRLESKRRRSERKRMRRRPDIDDG